MHFNFKLYKDYILSFIEYTSIGFAELSIQCSPFSNAIHSTHPISSSHSHTNLCGTNFDFPSSFFWKNKKKHNIKCVSLSLVFFFRPNCRHLPWCFKLRTRNMNCKITENKHLYKYTYYWTTIHHFSILWIIIFVFHHFTDSRSLFCI